MNKFIYIFFLLTQGVLYSQGLTHLIEDENVFNNYSFSQVNSFYFETVQKFDPLMDSHNLDISSENQLKWTLFNNDSKEIRFNNNGKVYLQKETYVSRDIQNEYNYQFSEIIKLGYKPISSENELFEGLNLFDTKLFTVLWWDEPAYFQLSKFRSPKYNKRGKQVGTQNGVIILRYPAPKVLKSYMTVDTDYSKFDLKEDNMKYNLKNYVTAFLMDICFGHQILLRNYYYNEEEFKKHNFKLNENDFNFLSSFLKEGKVKIEYKDLQDGELAYAVGNVFKNNAINIVVDPIKMNNATPSKRAYIMYHELFHTLDIDHGECGMMMFPYVEKEYSWRDWELGKLEAIECFVKKRNLSNLYKN